MLGILWVLVDRGALPSVDGKVRLDPQDLGGGRSCLSKVAQLSMGGGEPKVGNPEIRPARGAFAQRWHRFGVTLEHVVGVSEVGEPSRVLKWIETQIRVQHLDGP